MKKYFYSDPIKALYMMKEFGVKCEANCDELEESYDFDGWGVDVETISDLLEIFAENYPEEIFVKTECKSIFEPKKGDQGRYQTRLGVSYVHFNGEQWVGHAVNVKEKLEIIMRDGKHFFMPEEKNEQ